MGVGSGAEGGTSWLAGGVFAPEGYGLWGLPPGGAVAVAGGEVLHVAGAGATPAIGDALIAELGLTLNAVEGASDGW